MKAQESKYI